MTFMNILRRPASERGFTLAETMVALLIFSLVTLGLMPLFASTLRGSALARSYTVGKNTAIDSMERVRGLPFFVSYASKARRVDVLDLYFPNLNAGYSANSFSTTCASGSTNPACPANVPFGITILYKATFVRTSTYSTSPTRYDVVTPPAGYRWDSATGADVPPSQLLELSVKTSWDMGGETKMFELKTLFGDRKVGTVRVRGVGRVDYAAQVLAAYDISGNKSTLTFTGGAAESKVETKLLSTANENANVGIIRLLRASDDPTALGTDLGLSPLMGASTSLVAPPDSTPSGPSAGSRLMEHPDWGMRDIGFLGASNTSGLKVAVANELPTATGEAKTTGSSLVGWVHNQADATSDSLLQVENGESIFEISRTTRGIQSESTAVTTATTAADRKVETVADTKLGDVRVLPVKFISGTDDAVVRIGEFSASATCKATGNVSTATAAGSWTANLRYWKDPTADGIRNGAYVTEILNSSTAPARLEAIQAENPLVLDEPGTADDVYLFEDQALVKQGYLTDWSGTSPTATMSADGRLANVNIDGAIRMDTARTNPLNPETEMSISLGKLSCEAVDNR